MPRLGLCGRLYVPHLNAVMTNKLTWLKPRWLSQDSPSMINPSPQTLLDEIDLLKWKKKRRVALVVGYSGTGRLSSSLLVHHVKLSESSIKSYTAIKYDVILLWRRD